MLPVALRAQNYLLVTGDRPDSGPDLFKGLTISMANPPWTGSALLFDALKSAGFVRVDNTTWKPANSSDPKDVVTLRFVNFFTEISQVFSKNANAVLVVPPYEAIAQRELGMKWFPSVHPDVIRVVVTRMFDEGVIPHDVSMPKEAYDRNINGVLVDIGDDAANMPYDQVIDNTFVKKVSVK